MRGTSTATAIRQVPHARLVSFFDAGRQEGTAPSGGFIAFQTTQGYLRAYDEQEFGWGSAGAATLFGWIFWAVIRDHCIDLQSGFSIDIEFILIYGIHL